MWLDLRATKQPRKGMVALTVLPAGASREPDLWMAPELLGLQGCLDLPQLQGSLAPQKGPLG